MWRGCGGGVEEGVEGNLQCVLKIEEKEEVADE